MKKALLLLLTAVLLFSAATFCAWAEEPAAEKEAVVRLPSSTLYTHAELLDAAAQVCREFDAWEGCELHSIRYAGDASSTAENLKWMNELNQDGNYTQVAAFLMDFHSPVKGGGAWEPDKEYTDYEFWLARSTDGGWDLLTWGY